MRTGTKFISEISAATMFTSFKFHIFRFSSFRFSVKGVVDVYRMRICMCMCFIVSIPCHGIRSSRHQGVSPPRNHLATNQLATKKPPRHQPTRRQISSRGELGVRTKFACLSVCMHVVGDVI